MKTTAQQVLDQVDLIAMDEKIANDPAAISFADFGLPPKLMQSLNRMNFTTPTPIQAKAIPLALKGNDVLGSAQTGTGKTGAFSVPVIARLIEDPRMCALVMTPTRELAAQVMAAMQQMVPVPNIKTALLIGGESMPKQFKQLQQNPRLVVGTPGRIHDHLMRHTLDLRYTRMLVLDEMDRMLDMGFGIQIDKILSYMPNDNRQTLMFSATMPPSIIKLSQKYMQQNPQRIAVGSTTTPIANIKQDVVQVADGQKYDALLKELSQREGAVIVFVRTKHGADRMATRLNREGVTAEAIHGDLQQRKRDRVIQEFRDKRYRVMVATDVAARGLDIPHLQHVINYDLPQVPEDYIHRIGRTARAGATGSAVNFVSPSEKNKWRAIQRLINDGESDDSNFTQKSKKSSSFKGRSAKPFGRKDYGDSPKPNRSLSNTRRPDGHKKRQFNDDFGGRNVNQRESGNRDFNGGAGKKPASQNKNRGFKAQNDNPFLAKRTPRRKTFSH